jgi:tetratricopeptide (TPR) repeat protein
MEEVMKNLINLLMAVLFLAMMACGANLSAKKKVPAEPVKTPLQLAAESAQSADMAYEEKDYSAALEKYNQAIDLYNQAAPTAAPEDSVARKIFVVRKNIANVNIMNAQSLSAQKEYGPALQSYETAIAQYNELLPLSTPDDSLAARMPILYKNTAITSRLAGEPDTALQYYDKYLDLNPDENEKNDVQLQKFAIYKDDLKNKPQAYEVYKKYALARNDANAFQWLGNQYVDENDITSAIYWYEKADSVKVDANVLKNLGNLYRNEKIQMWAKSNDALEKFITLSPSKDELKLAYKLIGDNYGKLKNKPKSIEYFEKYIALEYNEKVALLICQFYNDKKDYNTTIKWANLILQTNPSNPTALLFRGIARYNLKDNKGAKADFELIKNDPNYGKNAQDFLKAIK